MRSSRGRAVAWALVAGLASIAADLVWRSRAWPLVHDAPIMQYIAWRIGEGALPYRDLFDMNQPGVYLLHRAAFRVLGDGDLAWRAFDLCWLALGALGVAALAARWGTVAAGGGALLFAVHHLADGAWQTGQRDLVLCPFLLFAAHGLACWIEDGEPERMSHLVRAGLVLGGGITIKPHAALLGAAFTVLVALAAWRAPVRPAAAFVLSAAVLPAAVLGWLATIGALGAWREITFGYLVPLYSRLGRSAGWTFHRWQVSVPLVGPIELSSWHVWIPMTGAVLLSILGSVAGRRFGPRHLVAVIGVAYGVLHFFGQRKGWEYHLYPLAAFIAVLAFSEVKPLLAERRLVLGAPLAACLGLAVVLLGAKGTDAAGARWIEEKVGRVSVLAAELDARLGPGDTVQVLDTTEGGIHALLRLRVRQPTRFVYDFHFFHDPDTPVIRSLRAEFVRDLAARPPRLVVLFERGWPGGGYERVESFPELRALLDTAYAIASRGDGYVIHAKRDHR